MDDYRVRIGAWIKDERAKRSWSQNELARRAKIPEMTSAQISRWERGFAMPSARNFAALEHAFGVRMIPSAGPLRRAHQRRERKERTDSTQRSSAI